LSEQLGDLFQILGRVIVAAEQFVQPLVVVIVER
jgi:hypothetical protein